ncbi:12511_t:CDS:10 [Acaulospora colombiana]|uniref:12511_t:CDS:1 n=1 Tax=Acaulospora colombiana TaxID=27376 RepID=A0ACA9L3H7_9GLOM|nr:12511_t:CDS:10 [Acaulospora colombiana]
MDALYFKAERLRLLWNEYRFANEGVDRDYGDQSEWARNKLQNILTEFDKLIQEQILWKSTLSADIEDLLVEIEEYCQLFGRNVDTIIPHAASINYELNDITRDRLKAIRDALREEVNTTRDNVNNWIAHLASFVKELEGEYQVPPEETFVNDLSASVVQPVWFKYDEMVRIVAPLRESFEEFAIQLHHYWTMLNYTPQDKTDEALFELFADRTNPKELYETLQETLKTRMMNNDSERGESELERQIREFGSREYIYYKVELPSGLRLNKEQLEILKNKMETFEKDYVVRKGKLDMLKKGIINLYNELNVPEEERVELIDSLDEEYLEQLTLEFERLREIMRVIIQKAIEEYTVQLGELWDKCLVPQYEREAFFENLRQLESSEEVYELLAQEIARLQELYFKCAKIYKWMLDRRALIEKMIDFEKKASDPKRLFQSSFRLLEEEKWRKSCWPNLVRIEEQLINACVSYEEAERKPFMHESKRYLDTLYMREGSNGFSITVYDAAKGSKDQKPAKSNKNSTQSSPKRQDSRSSSKVSASRPVSPTFSVNGDYSSRRNSQLYVPKHTPSRPVSPSSLSGGLSSRRNSQAPRLATSRSVSPSGGYSRRNLASPARSLASSRAVSPVRSTSPTPNRRNSMYVTSPLDSNSSSNTSASRRSSLYVRGTDEADVKRGHKINKSNDDKVGISVTSTQRSNSVSSNSSESSSVSSVATPTTPEPSSYVVNGRLGVPTASSKNKTQSEGMESTDKDKRIKNSPAKIPTRASTLNGSSSATPSTRRTNTAPPKARPRSVIGGLTSEPSAMLKKQTTKRMSMIVDSGH